MFLPRCLFQVLHMANTHTLLHPDFLSFQMRVNGWLRVRVCIPNLDEIDVSRFCSWDPKDLHQLTRDAELYASANREQYRSCYHLPANLNDWKSAFIYPDCIPDVGYWNVLSLPDFCMSLPCPVDNFGQSVFSGTYSDVWRWTVMMIIVLVLHRPSYFQFAGWVIYSHAFHLRGSPKRLGHSSRQVYSSFAKSVGSRKEV